MKQIFYLLSCLLFFSCQSQQTVADLILTNGKIVTVDSLQTEAQAIAIKGDRIIALGTNDKIKTFMGAETEVIDLKGALATPGFIEGHGHFMSLGASKMMLDLNHAASWDEIVSMVAEAVKNTEPGVWITGRGWHQEKWTSTPDNAIDGLPLHYDLSQISPDNPVILGHASGHASFVNKQALDLARISSETPNPAGGEIVHDLRGEPTGMLRETAQNLVRRVMSSEREDMTDAEIDAEAREQANLAMQEILSKGITSFHDAGASFETIDFFKKLADEDALKVRLYVMVRGQSNEELKERLPTYRMIGYGNHFLTVRSIKRQVDGALGPHGAWLLAPYFDLPTSTGLILEPLDDIEETCNIAIENGFQVNTHAIGDKGNQEILNLYEKIYNQNPKQDDLRWRIEHAQHLHPTDIPRFSSIGVIASMQGVHCTSDAPWVLKRLGTERAESGAYMWRDLWDSGAVVTNGTDVPVEDISPIVSYYATVTRKQKDGVLFYPAQVLSRYEALQTYTINNAYSAFEEKEKGSLVVGKLADITVFSSDILTIPEDDILSTKVLYTIVGGKIMYKSES